MNDSYAGAVVRGDALIEAIDRYRKAKEADEASTAGPWAESRTKRESVAVELQEAVIDYFRSVVL